MLSVFLLSCAKQESYPPAGNSTVKSDTEVSKERAKSLNEMERRQIEKWIGQQDRKFYIMPLNYWTDIADLSTRSKRADTEKITYAYEIYDFLGNRIYDKPKGYREVAMGKVPEVKPVEDALRYLKKNEETTLLLPSVLAYGTFGDGDRISNDLPLVIKLKITD